MPGYLPPGMTGMTAGAVRPCVPRAGDRDCGDGDAPRAPLGGTRGTATTTQIHKHGHSTWIQHITIQQMAILLGDAHYLS